MPSENRAVANCPISKADARMFNVDEALSHADGDKELLAQLMEMYLVQSNQDIIDIESAISRKDAKRLEFVAHSLKGASATLAAEPVRELAYKMEKVGSSGVLSEASALLIKLKESISMTNEQVSKALEMIRSGTEGRP